MTAWRGIIGVAGLGLMAYAAYGLFETYGAALGRPVLFAAALLVGHEAVLMPAVIAAGWVVVRAVPTWARAAVQGALAVTLALTIIAIPMLANAGAFPDNPSLLPRDYRRGLLIAVGVTWLIGAAVAVVNRQRRHSRRPPGGDG